MTGDEKNLIKGYYQLKKKWGGEILEKYDLTLEKLLKFYGYHFDKKRNMK